MNNRKQISVGANMFCKECSFPVYILRKRHFEVKFSEDGRTLFDKTRSWSDAQPLLFQDHM